jgi:ABC-type glycerol-3-phosphate transport system substrate-binding protein
VELSINMNMGIKLVIALALIVVALGCGSSKPASSAQTTMPNNDNVKPLSHMPAQYRAAIRQNAGQ